MLTIAAVERDTGLSKDLLRVWERRYGFPMPQRDTAGERAYPPEQVARLRLVKRLLDDGHRPGRVLPLGGTALQALVAAEQRSSDRRVPHSAATAPELPWQTLLALLRTHDLAALHALVAGQLGALGVRQFVLQFAAPLQCAATEAWLHGRLHAFEQRACLQALQAALGERLGAAHAPDLPADASPVPRVLLTTLPGEPQTFGLQLAQALLEDAGCCCIALGAQLPAWDIQQAAVAYRADVVTLGFGDTLGANAVVSGLTDLRALLPTGIALWVGGAERVLQRRRVAGAQPLSLQDLLPALARWRDKMAAGAAVAPAVFQDAANGAATTTVLS